MNTYWLTFTDKSEACCQGMNEFHAKSIAEKLTGKKVAGGAFKDIAAKPLPYPATPIVWQFDDPCYGKCPPFCYAPRECAGRTSCPKSRACSE